MKKRFFIAAIIAVGSILLISVFAWKPAVICKVDVPDHYLEAIESQSKGIYSSKVPLPAVYISVDALVEERVYYTIHYFPFGTVGMSYAKNDGYNIEKPLTGL